MIVHIDLFVVCGVCFALIKLFTVLLTLKLEACNVKQC